MSHSYSTAIEGGAPVSVRYTIRGRLDPERYLAFVAERARWFGIAGHAAAERGDITLVASGPEAMVGALEMACLLGPIDALVESIAAEEAAPVAGGFRIGQK